MPRLSLTDFVDIVSKSGTPKATKIRQIKDRGAYHPSQDFYKKIRERIIETHESGLAKSHISDVLGDLTDQKKVRIYPDLVANYNGWWGRKSLVWFSPPHALFSHGGCDVAVNPELGLEINGEPHLIKLYFKAEPLQKSRTEIITHLMAVLLADECPEDTTMSVLDIQNRKLLSPTVPVPDLDAMLLAELTYVKAFWDQI